MLSPLSLSHLKVNAMAVHDLPNLYIEQSNQTMCPRWMTGTAQQTTQPLSSGGSRGKSGILLLNPSDTFDRSVSEATAPLTEGLTLTGDKEVSSMFVITSLHCYHIGWLDHQSPESRIALRAMYSCMRQLLDGSDAEENGLLWFGCWFPMGQVPKIGGFNITQMEFPEHLYRSRGVEISWDVWSDSDKNFISLASLVSLVFLGCLTTVRCDFSICYGIYLYV